MSPVASDPLPAASADPILVVGSVALDDISTPAGSVNGVVGGAAVHFSAAASIFAPVQLVGVVGSDYPVGELGFLQRRGTDLSGLAKERGESFRWGGSYHDDMKTRETTFTELGVFAGFQPSIPEAFGSAPRVFLANIHPELQLDVLGQIDKPLLVACDTMNYWIDRTPQELEAVIAKVDAMLLNDEEAAHLSGNDDLTGAGRWIQRLGPRHVVIKRGELGAVLFSGEDVAVVPGYAPREVVDPTGAGDAFAGGMLGYLARCGSDSAMALRRATAYGCALGSFACEEFGVARMEKLTLDEVEERIARTAEAGAASPAQSGSGLAPERGSAP